jgi:hypothetical protein
VLLAAVAPSSIAPHLAALGAGGLATYGARMGAQYGNKRAQEAHGMDQQTSGIPGYTAYGTLSGYAPRFAQPMGQIDPFVAGFSNAQPVYGHAYHG